MVSEMARQDLLEGKAAPLQHQAVALRSAHSALLTSTLERDSVASRSHAAESTARPPVSVP